MPNFNPYQKQPSIFNMGWQDWQKYQPAPQQQNLTQTPFGMLGGSGNFVENQPLAALIGQMGSPYSQENLARMQQLLAPLFQQQFGTLQQAQGVGLANASRTAQAEAASRGYDSSAALGSRFRSGVFGQFAPQFNQLAESQLQAPITLAGQERQEALQRLLALLSNSQFQENSTLAQQQQARGGVNDILGGFLGLGGQLGGAAILASDRRLKKNIVKIGKYNGLNVYRFDYVWGTPSIGVMADEVKKIKPDAVTTIGGYDFVNYGVL